MSGADSRLQRRYLRLLTCYPRQFREQRGDELLAVLLDAARDGQRFPKPREAADLLAHGLLARIRPHRLAAGSAAVDDREVKYGDALAAANVHGLGAAQIGTWSVPTWLKRLTALVGAAAIAIAIAVAIAYVFFDHALAGYSGTGSAVGAVGHTSFHGVPVRPAGNGGRITTLNLQSVTPRIAVNTAHATVTVLVCTGFADHGAGFVYGGSSQDAAGDCNRLTDFRSGTIRLGTSPDTQLTTGVVLAVTPHTAGIVRIEGADAGYRQGIRRGNQHVGTDWSLRVP